jgi:hypothetical protein
MVWSAGIRRCLGALFTFLVVAFTWLFFRVNNFADIAVYLAGLGALDFSGAVDLVPLAFLAVVTLAVDIPQALTGDEFCFLRLPFAPRVAAAAAAVLLLLFSGGPHEPFIYFQF